MTIFLKYMGEMIKVVAKAEPNRKNGQDFAEFESAKESIVADPDDFGQNLDRPLEKRIRILLYKNLPSFFRKNFC
jgi:hypothetical protein